jgi:DNA polymerase-3 subunit gamma/tau
VDSKSSNYQVIARKYRPQTFSSVVGQETIVTTLKNALRFKRLAHAYLFCGCRGTGKTTLARVFAKALNCILPTEDFEPCNACPSCLDVIAGRSLDVLEIDGASNRGIDDIRQINETIGYAPASGKYKIYIIDEVHMLTKEAFNALLKTLEEPPANVKFFFATTEPHKVLPTIISRCQRFDLNRIPFEALTKKLAWIAQDMNIVCDEDVFSMVANLAEGSLRDAESLFDQIICYAEHPITAAKVSATLGIMPRSAFFALDNAYSQQTLSYAFELAGDIFSSGKDLSYFLDNLIEHYRSLLKLKLGASGAFATARLKEQYAASSLLYTEEQCLYILDFLIHWQQQIGKTPFKRVSLEMILLHIIRSKHRLTLPALVKRLIELQQKLATSHQTPLEMPPAAPLPASSPLTAKLLPEKECEALPTPLATLPDSVTVTARPFPEKEPETPQTLPVNLPNLEETLIKKIREKIESASMPETFINSPPLIEEPLSEANIEGACDSPSKQFPLLLSKTKWEAIASDGQIQTITPSPIPEKAISSYDTLMRFAAVELEGIIKKEQPNG